MSGHLPESVGAATIPVIDLNASDAASSLLHAAATYGFVFVKHENIGLTPEAVESMFQLSKDLFSSDSRAKAECLINSKLSGKNRGWLPMHSETLDPAKQKKGDFKEAFNVGQYVNGKAQQPLPTTIQEREGQIGKFFDDCHELSNRILELFAVALKIPEEEGGSSWFASRHDQSRGTDSVLRLLYYPALPESARRDAEQDIRAGAHSDYGSVTLLFRLPNQPGLEILTPQETWASVPVDPEPGVVSKHLPILVNIGDILSYWTNGLLRSTVHRVIFPGSKDDEPHASADRYSMAYFCHPESDARLIEIPSDVVAQHGRNTNGESHGSLDVMTAKDYLNARLAATYDIKG